MRASTRATPGIWESSVAYSLIARSALAPVPTSLMSGATTCRALASSPVNSVRSTSTTWRLVADRGSTRSSGRPSLIPRNGLPSTRRMAIVPRAIGHGRFMTPMAMRCQMP